MVTDCVPSTLGTVFNRVYLEAAFSPVKERPGPSPNSEVPIKLLLIDLAAEK